MNMDLDALQERIDYINAMVVLHQGRVELVSAEGGVVRVKFAGLCNGCMLRPVTLNALVRPAICSLQGVDRVEAVGVRISAEAEETMEALRSDPWSLAYQ
jgi:Fe-S cluster biogenesis protein NfuA